MCLQTSDSQNRRKGEVMRYEELDGRYRLLSCENTRRARRIDTAEAYERAQSRERLIRRAFFADCKRYLNEDLKPKR